MIFDPTHEGPLTDVANTLHRMKYRGVNESFREAMNRIAFGLKDDDRHYHALRSVLLPQRFLPGGRIQSAIGSSRDVSAYNCMVSGTIADSYVEGAGCIMDRAKEAATTMRMGCGIGYDFSTLRPRGDFVRRLETTASGPVSFLGIFDAVCKATLSAGHRRGAQMGVLRVDHPDIEEFIRSKQTPGALEGFNLSVAITDEFMEAVAVGKPFALRWGGRTYREVDAAELWEKIMRSTWDWAEPGVLFVDRINEMNNLYYYETIAATNPCFTGDTLVWTADGHKSFADLAESGAPVKVLTVDESGRFIYRTMRRPRRTRRDAKLVEVTLSRPNGNKKNVVTTVRCTPSHEFYLRDGGKRAAGDLRKGDRISSVYKAPRGKGYVGLHNHKVHMMEHHVPFENITGLGISVDVHHIDEDKTNNRPDNLELRDHGEHSSEHRKGDGNGMRKHPERNHFNGRDNNGANNGMHGKRHKKATLAKIGGKTSERFLDPAFRARHAAGVRRGMALMTDAARANNHVVRSVRWLDIREDVYCGTVDETHSFFIATGPKEGVLVANCAEQPLPPNGACLLGSFNLPRYLKRDAVREDWEFNFEQLEMDVGTIVPAMDNVVDRAKYPLPAQKAEAVTKRRMGLGVTGLANAGEALGFPYASRGFLDFEKKVLALIRDSAYRASAFRAAERGSFPLYDAEKYLAGKFVATLPEDVVDLITTHGIRNSHLLSIAPTGTISMTADNVSSGIEPVFAHTTQRLVYTPEGSRERVVDDFGVGFLDVRGRTANQTTPGEHVEVLATASKLVDSAISKTINIPSDVSWADFKRVYADAYAGGAKGCTTYRIGGLREALLTDGSGEDSCAIDPETGRRDCA